MPKYVIDYSVTMEAHGQRIVEAEARDLAVDEFMRWLDDNPADFDDVAPEPYIESIREETE